MVIDVRDGLWKLFWIFIITHILFTTRYEASMVQWLGCSALKLRVVGSNPAADILFSTQITVLMQNLGLILFKNHELCSLAHFGTVKLYMG